MRAIIPTAGMGTRLRPHTHTAPKVLLNVAGKPILGHIVDELMAAGVVDITFIVGYLGHQVTEYIESHYPNLRSHFVEQEERKGLGHAIWLTRELFPEPGPALIILGDTIFQADLGTLMACPQTAIAVREVEDPSRFGIVETDSDGQILRMVEKPDNPSTNLAIVGIYSIHDTRPLFECLGELVARRQMTRGEYQLTDALAMMIERGESIISFPIEGWFDCGKPETLLATNRHLMDMAEEASYVPDTYSNSIIIPPVSISPGARVKHSIIGPYVSISAGADIRHSIISDSIISEQATVWDINLCDSIVAHNARVVGYRTRLNVGDSSEVMYD